MKIHDNGIDREATPQEVAAHEKLVKDTEVLTAQWEAVAAARASARAKLKALGLTDAEVAALAG